jgi:hypothetical protein
MHTRNYNFSKIFTRSLWEKFLEEIVSEGENRMIKVNTMIAVMEMIEIEDEGLIPIRIVDGGDVSIGIRKEERPNFPSPIPPPPYLNLRWRWSRKMVINGFTLHLHLHLHLHLYLYLKVISPRDFSFPPRFRFSGPLIPFPWSVS